MKVAFLVQGLFEISDSIGYDCVHQYRTASRLGLADEIRIFAERFVPERYPDLHIETIAAFKLWASEEPDLLVIYHFCGAWDEMDEFLFARSRDFIVRWHNNTPPWFFLDEGHNNVRHTLAGFAAIRRLIASGRARFWVNSQFTRRQLTSIGDLGTMSDIVFPASRYLDEAATTTLSRPRLRAERTQILFTSRLVAHKGHLGVLAVAALVQRASGRRVLVNMPGRPSNHRRRIEADAVKLGLDASLPGEVTEAELRELVLQADVFVCLSEHEGFGLPVFEAMRCRVPVVVWATTALEDLMAGHPLAFRDYDLDRFAAAVLALDDEDVRRDVLRAQDEILGRYTAEIVTAQLRTALTNARQSSATLPVDRLPSALQADAALLSPFSDIMAEAGRLPPKDGADLEYDSARNLVSLYDVAAYRRYFDALKEIRFAPVAAGSDIVRITPPEFDTRVGEVRPDAIVFEHRSLTTQHLVFGPYLEFPPGDYAVDFDFDARAADNSTPSFQIDVADARGTISKRFVTLRQMRSANARTLHFSLPVDAGAIEFRVRPRRPYEGDFVFRGVDVTRTSGPH